VKEVWVLNLPLTRGMGGFQQNDGSHLKYGRGIVLEVRLVNR
jgi:hypothetical protein